MSFSDGCSEDHGGEPVSFLGTDDSFQYVKTLHEQNLIVPVIGDFAGETALRSVGNYVRRQHDVIGVFYGSNVDSFLNSDQLLKFCTTVAEMPVGDRSVYIGGDGSKMARLYTFAKALEMCGAGSAMR